MMYGDRAGGTTPPDRICGGIPAPGVMPGRAEGRSKMGNLRDELIKKGVVSGRRAQQLAHEDRSLKRRQGKSEAARQQRQAEEERSNRERDRRLADRERESERRAARETAEKRHALAQMIAEHALDSRFRGSRRFFFISREKTLPHLELSDAGARGLEEGRLTICELPDSRPQRFVLLDAADARRVAELDDRWILFQNDGPA